MIVRHTSPNGVRIVLEEVPTVRSVTIGVWVLTGSRNETEITSGMSHFIEHMLFKGTKTRTAQDIAEAFDSIGGQVNAFTSKEYTCFYTRVVDTHKEYALELLTDMFFHSTFPEEEIEREKKVVFEEIKMYEDAPDDLVYELLSETTYGNHPLGRSILGTEATLTDFTRDSIIDYKNKHYTPNNVVISVAGNADEKFIQEIEAAFNQFTVPKQTLLTEKPIFLPEEIIRQKDTEQAHICYGFEGISVADDRMVTLSVVANVLGGGMSSRLFQEVREKRGLAYSVYAHHSSASDSGMFIIYAGTNKEQLPLVETTITETLTSFIEKGITEKELRNTKEQLKGSILLGLESMSGRMNRNGRAELLLNRHRTLDEITEDIDAVDEKMVQNVLDDILNKAHSKAIVTP